MRRCGTNSKAVVGGQALKRFKKVVCFSLLMFHNISMSNVKVFSAVVSCFHIFPIGISKVGTSGFKIPATKGKNHSQIYVKISLQVFQREGYYL